MSDVVSHAGETAKHITDGTAVTAWVTVFTQVFNPLLEAGVLIATLVWMVYRIIEIKTNLKKGKENE